jgi:hypothetical protein
MHYFTALSEDAPSCSLIANLLYLVARRTSRTFNRLGGFRGSEILFENFELTSNHTFHVAENNDHYVVYAIKMPLVYVLLDLLDFTDVSLNGVHVEVVETDRLSGKSTVERQKLII